MQIQTVLDWMADLAPPRFAAKWDNVGLMVGDPGEALKGVLVAVDPTFECLQEAQRRGANLVITHHPLLFHAPKSLDERREPGRSVAFLHRHRMALHAAHTNLDTTAVNLALAQALGLEGSKVLHAEGNIHAHKVVTFVPEEQAEAVAEAAWGAGAGESPRYDRVGHRSPATGAFRPRLGARPAIGSAGQDSRVAEARLEFMVPGDRLGNVLRAIQGAHPYEEPVIDVFQLARGGNPHGFGLVGDLPAEESLDAFARRVKAALGVDAVRVVGDPRRVIRRAAWLGGAGGEFCNDAIAAGADVYITGELRHHTMLDAAADGLALVEVGHVGSEQPVVPYVAAFLEQKLGGKVPVHALAQKDPFRVL